LRQLDRVIDLNLYPIATARASNLRWRPVGLGVMGLQDVFFKLRLAFDGIAARQLSTRIAETIYFHALHTSMELARECRAHDAFADTRAAQGELQFDAWGVTPSKEFRWDEMVDQIKAHGMRNSLLIAIAPTATIASIAGCYECIEPQLSNLGAFAYVYFLRSRGLLPGLAAAAGCSQRHADPTCARARKVLSGHAAQLPDLCARPVRRGYSDGTHGLSGRPGVQG